MKILKLTTLAFALAIAPTAAMAGGNSGGHHGGGHGGHRPVMGGHHGGGHGGYRPVMGRHHGGGHVYNRGHHGPRNWGRRHNGRWFAGYGAPGGWAGYQRPFYGFSLPTYWSQPSYIIPNYASYGFAQPSYGYTWSRYYDDAVMTDRYGRVYNHVPNVQWDRYDRYEDAGYGNGGYANGGYNGGGYYEDRGYDDRGRGSRYGGRRGNGAIEGGVAGAAIGAVGGAIVAGRGDRTAGALIGGGLGALAGTVVGGSRGKRDDGYRGGRYSTKRDRRDERDLGYDYGADDDVYVGNSGGGYGSGVYGSQGNDNAGAYPAPIPADNGATYPTAPQYPTQQPQQYPTQSYPTPVYSTPTAPVRNGNTTIVYTGPGTAGYDATTGYNTVTVQGAPVVTTSTTTTEYVTEYVTVAARKRVYHKPAARKVHRARKPRCQCRIVYK
jgi:Ni/Co efflux regulator RcnB